MKTATALTIAAIGAILAFAVTAQPSFFSFHTAGWVLMATGIAGLVIPRRSYGWLRRRLVLNAGGGQRPDIAFRQRRYSKLLVPGGLITEDASSRVARDAGGPVERDTVESDTVEQFIEE